MRAQAPRDEPPLDQTGGQVGKGVRYEFKTVNTIRGAENRAVMKWANQGWELVDQDPGTLRTQMTFRRARKPTNRLLVVGGISAVMILVVAIVAGIISEGNDPVVTSSDPSESARTEVSAETESTTQSEPSQASDDDSAGRGGAETVKPAAGKVLTVQNSPEFAKVLGVLDYCDPTIAEFASKYADETVVFNGSISNMTPHKEARTRYDILVAPGDDGASSTVGPAFQLRDVGVIDLNLVGPNIPPTVGAGEEIRLKATVGEFNPDSCLLVLNPVETRVR